MAEDDEQRLSHTQRLKAAVHYTVGKLCQAVAEDKQINFNKQAIAAISEITFRQCETFAKDLEMFARHGKRSAVNMDDVKLLSRRSRSLYTHISAYSDEIASSNQEETEKRKKKPIGTGKRRSDGDSAAAEGEDME
ncbi:centromere protein S isoform X2 [Hyla sarda]|uniref:centromere protein S isoform X2 n=1 Tax=Hyla sarda TaxID=327740 RepID=UPI0024C269D9|nr:centromere protein S isoform X2 [Hyla sarda]